MPHDAVPRSRSLVGVTMRRARHAAAPLLSAWLLLTASCAKAETDDARGHPADGGGVDDDGALPADAGPGDAAGDSRSDGADGSPADAPDGARPDTTTGDTGATDSALADSAAAETSTADTAVVLDSVAVDSGTPDTGPVETGTPDSGTDSGGADTGASGDTATGGIVTGGPCLSGAAGATAFRVRWRDSGGTATVSYEVDGLPDKSRWKAGAYGYGFGFTPSFVDPFLGEGGLQLDSSDFVDIELSTAGISTIRSASLAIYGRSYATTTSGSFSWNTFTGADATPTDFVSNVAPYRWYAFDTTTSATFVPGDGGVLLRIKAGPSSGALVVNRIELCLDAS